MLPCRRGCTALPDSTKLYSKGALRVSTNPASAQKGLNGYGAIYFDRENWELLPSVTNDLTRTEHGDIYLQLSPGAYIYFLFRRNITSTKSWLVKYIYILK